MAASLLYFPYINLPKADWTIRNLLYYETIGSIVPMEYFSEPKKNYDPFMLSLVREELVMPINPMERLDEPWRLNEPFLNFIQSAGFKLEEKRHFFLRGETAIINKQKLPQKRSPQINSQKFDHELLYALSHLGLARHTKDNWYEVEKTTANYLMTYLASVLAGKLNMLPATDKSFPIDFLRQFRSTKNIVNNKRDRVLRELIPLPVEINLSRLQGFKDRHLDNLNRFKNLVEQIALNPIYDDETLLSDKIRELQFEKEQLTARMNETNFGTIFFGSACGVFGAFQGLAQAETTGAILGGLPGFASTIYAALKIEKAEDAFDQTGLKYLSLVDKRLRLPNQRRTTFSNG